MDTQAVLSHMELFIAMLIAGFYHSLPLVERLFIVKYLVGRRRPMNNIVPIYKCVNLPENQILGCMTGHMKVSEGLAGQF